MKYLIIKLLIFILFYITLLNSCSSQRPSLKTNLIHHSKNASSSLSFLVIPDLEKIPTWVGKKHSKVEIITVVSCPKLSINEIARLLNYMPNVKVVELHGQGLTEIPDELSNVKHLDLSLNRIENISPYFQSNSLLYLGIDNNDLGSLEVQKLNYFFLKLADRSKIKSLSISNNYLDTLPDSFEKLSEVEFLYVGFNRFKYFPRVITKLPKIKVISIDYIPTLLHYPAYIDNFPYGTTIRFTKAVQFSSDNIDSLAKRYPNIYWE